MSSVRRQASLGTEFKRVYDEDKNKIKIMLAQVTKIHHRYNTVDVQSLSGTVKVDKTGGDSGRFSAMLPVQFSGRTTEGKPFGQVTSIEIGSLVLIGFVDGKKFQPIVLSIYGKTDESQELSRSPVAESDPSDAELKKYTQHQFTVYPSLTYKDIDGDGNVTASFTGKSFFATDDSSDPDVGALSDDGYGTSYEDLDSSYYYSGELIEPKSKKAPSILFRHVGNNMDQNGVEVEDDHVTMVHFAQDGTYRTSVLKESDDWRAYFELTKDGQVRLRRQNDSKAIGQGNDINEVSVDDTGVLLRAGDKYVRLTPNGWTGNIGMGGGGDYDTDISNLKDGLLELGTKFEQTDEYVRITAREVIQDVEGKITEFEATFEVTARQIESRVTETVTDLMTNELQDIIDDIDDINENAREALAILASISDDGILSPLDKKTLLLEWDMIRAEYPSFVQQAAIVSVSDEEYVTAYTQLKNYIEPLLANSDESSNIDRLEFMNYFNNYFNARGNLLYSVFRKLKDELDQVAQNAIDAGLDAATALADSATSITRANRANEILAHIAEDNIITPQEKPSLRREYENIVNEWQIVASQAEEYEIPTLNYEEAKDNLISFIESTGMFDNMNEETEINGTLLTDVFASYYEERTKLLQRVSAEARRQLLEFEGNLEHFETSITETAREIALVAQSVQLIDREVRLNRAELIIQADRITSRVTKTEMQREVNTNINKLNNVGRNLFVRGISGNGEISPSTGEVTTGNNSPVVSSFITVESLSDYTLTAYSNDGNNILSLAWYDANRVFISGESVSGSENPLSLSVTSPPGTKFARISTQQRNTVNAQFEFGKRATPFKASPEDMVADLNVARLERDNRLAIFQEFETKHGEVRTEGIQDLSIIETISEDSTLTPADKIRLQEIMDRINVWHPTVINEAELYTVSTVAYEGSYAAIEEYVSGYLSRPNSTEPVIARTIVNLFNRFYESRTTVYNNIVRRTRESYEAADAILDEVSNSALEAQQLAERLREEAEQAARSATETREAINEANSIESISMSIISSTVADSVFTAEEKVDVHDVFYRINDLVAQTKAMALVYSLSTADVDNAHAQLSSYLSPMLNGTARIEDSDINAQTFVNNFQNVFTANAQLLQAVLDGANGRYDQANQQADIANDEYIRRQNQMTIYQNAIKDSQYHIERLEEKIDEFNNVIPYTMQLTSSHGFFFRDDNIYTKLSVVVLKGNEDITALIPTEEFVWTKRDEDGNEDVAWNTENVGVGREVEITHQDVQRKAVFAVDIDRDLLQEVEA